jgi:hypothetical protein
MRRVKKEDMKKARESKQRNKGGEKNRGKLNQAKKKGWKGDIKKRWKEGRRDDRKMKRK